MDHVRAAVTLCDGRKPLAVAVAALILLACPVFADAQSDALAQAQRICHDTVISPGKKAAALSGWRQGQPTNDTLWHAGAARMLVYGGAFEPPYQLDPASLRAAIPTIEDRIRYEVDDLRWASDEGYITMLSHSSGWGIAIEADSTDPSYTSCILWHDELSEQASASAQSLTGVFPGSAKPFQTLIEAYAWVIRGTFDHDLSIAVSRPDQSLYPAFAEIYLLIDHYSYDLTEDY